jgi:hypothetical protein
MVVIVLLLIKGCIMSVGKFYILNKALQKARQEIMCQEDTRIFELLDQLPKRTYLICG